MSAMYSDSVSSSPGSIIRQAQMGGSGVMAAGTNQYLPSLAQNVTIPGRASFAGAGRGKYRAGTAGGQRYRAGEDSFAGSSTGL